MQSHNYVPGVSGWKMDSATGAFEMASDKVIITGADAKAEYTGKRAKDPKPFIVVDGVTYIAQEPISDTIVTGNMLTSKWAVKMQARGDAEYVAVGIGLGIESQRITDADKFAIKPDPVRSDFQKAFDSGDAKAILDMISGAICESALGVELKTRIDADVVAADRIREVVREELAKAKTPGGLLYRK